MATLEKIRSKAGLLVMVVGLALFAFIITDFLNSGSSYFRQNQEQVAVVDGTPVNMMEYQQRVDEMTNVYRMQSQTNTVSEEINGQIRQSVYDGLVREIVMKDAISKLGIQVTPDELYDMVQGDNLSPMAQQFPYFMDPQTGAYSKTRALSFLKTIENIETIPADQRANVEQARQYWLFWERNMKMQRLQDKYSNLLTKAIVANPLDAKNAYESTTPTSDITYVMQPYSTIPDSTIEISSSEIKNLYNQRKEQYKQPEMRVLDYIAVDIRPSQDDYEAVRVDMEKAKNELETTTNAAEVVNYYSEVPFLDAYVSAVSLDPDMAPFLASAEIGDIEGPLFKDESYRVVKLLDTKVEADSVNVSQIFFTTQGGYSEQQLNLLADSLVTVLKSGGDFAQLAQQYSMDQAATAGGELGWFTEAGALRMMGEEFRDTIFDVALNVPVLLKTSFGTHIIKVTEKTAPVSKYKIAYIVRPVTYSTKTQSDIYNALSQFVANNNTADKIATAAQESGYELMKDVKISSSDRILGSIADSRQVIRWAFEGTKKNDISTIFETNNNFIVAIRKDVLPEGYQSVQSVAPMLTFELRSKKKGEEIAKQLKEKNLTSMAAYAQAMDSRIDTVRFVSMNTTRISGIGLEPVLNAKITYAPLNQVNEPVIGNNGVYVFDVFDRHQEAGSYDEKSQVQMLESANANRVGYQAIQSLVDDAEITDNRIRFE